MSLGKTMDELERYIDYAASYFADVKSELDDVETEYINEIANLKDEVDTLREVNEELAAEASELSKKLALFELENMELRLRIDVYALDI